MVTIFLSAAALAGNEQERVATPSIWTVQAPHCAMPQPYLVPVRPTFSRMAQSSGVLGSTSNSPVQFFSGSAHLKTGPLCGGRRLVGIVQIDNRVRRIPSAIKRK